MINNTLLQDAMGMIDEEFIEEIIENSARPSKKLTWQRIAAVAACLCLTVSIATLTSIFFRGNTPSNTSDPDFSINIDQYIWSTESTDNMSVEIAVDDWYAAWNGWSITSELYQTLENTDDQALLAIIVETKSNGNNMMKFKYNGTTYEEIIIEQSKLEQKYNKLIEFYKVGEWLKYGEALYTTGIPDGERWSKQLYDSEVAYYGQEMLDRYIVNGELLSDKIMQDAEETQQQIEAQEQLLKDCLAAYHKQNSIDAEEVFVKTGVTHCLKNDSLYLFVSKQELEDIKILNKSKYILGLARKRVFEVDADELPVELDHNISGFDLEKMHLYYDGKTIQPTSDSQVITTIENIIMLDQYAYDHLEIHVDSTFSLTDPKNQLNFLKYDTIYHYKLNKSQIISIHINIKYENIDMQALQRLSNMEEITYIHIGSTLTPIPG
ncbi:MAG: hypothetical protein IJY27_04120 [Clostridia bacterium]|nr:hypothetical protein [Clostridia bacterium]